MNAPYGPVQWAAAVSVVMLLAVPGDIALALAAKQPIKLSAHRAVYDMTLDRSNSATAGISDVRGRMVFDFSGSACEGYTLNTRLVTQITDRSGQSTLSDLRTSSWEDGKGRQFHFNTTNYRNDKLNETTSGDAARLEGDKGIRVRLTKPETTEFPVEGKLLFPTQHSIDVILAAQAGKPILEAQIYDGSEQGKRVYSTTTFIGKAIAPGEKKPEERVKNDETLDSLESWPVAISYFNREGTGEQTPEYELSFRLYVNGVSRDIRIDYGDFTIRGTLKSLDYSKTAPCD